MLGNLSFYLFISTFLINTIKNEHSYKILYIFYSVTESILNVLKSIDPYWRCFSYQCELEEGELCPFDEVNEDPPK